MHSTTLRPIKIAEHPFRVPRVVGDLTTILSVFQSAPPMKRATVIIGNPLTGSYRLGDGILLSANVILSFALKFPPAWQQPLQDRPSRCQNPGNRALIHETVPTRRMRHHSSSIFSQSPPTKLLRCRYHQPSLKQVVGIQVTPVAFPVQSDGPLEHISTIHFRVHSATTQQKSTNHPLPTSAEPLVGQVILQPKNPLKQCNQQRS